MRCMDAIKIEGKNRLEIKKSSIPGKTKTTIQTFMLLLLISVIVFFLMEITNPYKIKSTSFWRIAIHLKCVNQGSEDCRRSFEINSLTNSDIPLVQRNLASANTEDENPFINVEATHKYYQAKTDHFKNRRSKISLSCSKVYKNNKSLPSEFDVESSDIKNENLLRYFYHSKYKNPWIYFNSESYARHKNSRATNSSIHYRPTHIAWCPIFKAASTTWMSTFTKLAGILTNRTEEMIHSGKKTFVQLAKDLRLTVPQWNEDSDKQYDYKMVVVRHPFERLVSAYRDKIQRVHKRDYYHRLYAKRIILNFRKGYTKHQNFTKFATAALIANIFKSRKHPPVASTYNKISHLEVPNEVVNYNEVPTFEEFVKFVLSQDPRVHDQHWRPMYLDCNPCFHKFDIIVKVENLFEERQIVLDLMNLSKDDEKYGELEHIWGRWKNKAEPKYLKYEKNLIISNKRVKRYKMENLKGTEAVRASVSGGKKMASSIYQYYYRQLKPSQIRALYKIYEPDFYLFDYDASEYIHP